MHNKLIIMTTYIQFIRIEWKMNKKPIQLKVALISYNWDISICPCSIIAPGYLSTFLDNLCFLLFRRIKQN